MKEIRYEENKGCWIITSHKLDKEGRLRCSRNGKLVTIAQIKYEEHHGPLAAGLILYRQCDNKLCINPAHHKAMTKADWAREKETIPMEYYVDENGCHICTSHKINKRGMLITMRNRKTISLIRVIYEDIHKVELMTAENVIHTCSNKLCINPEHIVVSTNASLYRREEIKYEIDVKTECWESINIGDDGKPCRTTRDGRCISQARILWEEINGDVPPGLNLIRTCRNLNCINPAHGQLSLGKHNGKEIEVIEDKYTGCLNVVSHANFKDQYAYFQINGKKQSIHRYVYTRIKGEIPDGMIILHSCDNKRCINPEHMSLGTNDDNMREAWDRGRMRGKLLPAEVKEIKILLSTHTDEQLAETYNISPIAIWSIRTGKTWKNI